MNHTLSALTLLATIYTADGPVIYPMAAGLTGPECVAGLRAGLTATDRAAIVSGRILPAGEGHIPTDGSAPDLRRAVLSCELDW